MPRIDCATARHPGPSTRPITTAQIRPKVWAAAKALLAERRFLHATELQALAGTRMSARDAGDVARDLVDAGLARWAEYAPTHSQLAFAGLGPSAFSGPEHTPEYWYIAIASPDLAASI